MASISTQSAPNQLDDLVVKITSEVGKASGTEPTNLPPVGAVVDMEGLNALVYSDNLCEITFSYYGYLVTVTRDGDVRVSSSE